MQQLLEILKAVLFGIVEGITEWLPISSTGHMILLDELVSLQVGDAAFSEQFYSMFEVVIQLGAILAVILLFFHKLNPLAPSKTPEERRATWILWAKVLLAIVPSGIVGVLADDFVDNTLSHYAVVAAALIVYGVAFILIERHRMAKGDTCAVTSVDAVSWRTAFMIGVFQILALIPGTSRSGSTILGAMLLGLSRTAASEFSFFMAIPTMLGASLVRGYKFYSYVSEGAVAIPSLAWIVLAVGCLVAFAVSYLAIRFLMDFVKRHTFTVFGIYRIALGLLVLVWFGIRTAV